MFRRVALVGEDDIDFFGHCLKGQPVAMLHGMLVSKSSLDKYVLIHARMGRKPICPFERSSDCTSYLAALKDLDVSVVVLDFHEKYSVENVRILLQYGELGLALSLVDVVCEENDVKVDAVFSLFKQRVEGIFARFNEELGLQMRFQSYWQFYDKLEEGQDDDANEGAADVIRDSLKALWLEAVFVHLKDLATKDYETLDTSLLMKIATLYESSNAVLEFNMVVQILASRCEFDEGKLNCVSAVEVLSLVSRMRSNVNIEPFLKLAYKSEQQPVINGDLLTYWVVANHIDLTANVFEYMPLGWVCLKGNKWYAELVDLLYRKGVGDTVQAVNNAFIVLVKRADHRYLSSAVEVAGVYTTMKLLLQGAPNLSDANRVAQAKLSESQ